MHKDKIIEYNQILLIINILKIFYRFNKFINQRSKIIMGKIIHSTNKHNKRIKSNTASDLT